MALFKQGERAWTQNWRETTSVFITRFYFPCACSFPDLTRFNTLLTFPRYIQLRFHFWKKICRLRQSVISFHRVQHVAHETPLPFFQATQPWIIIASLITVMVKQILRLCSSITKLFKFSSVTQSWGAVNVSLHPILYFQCKEVMKKVKWLSP